LSTETWDNICSSKKALYNISRGGASVSPFAHACRRPWNGIHVHQKQKNLP